uniref:Uncharacterized protein LOC116948118 n=1 Tax=Petromyzon marinus TaxID=7757 RepID=A0AAJ7TMA3_PETMA|nr:uncharacterized protein LOC116948118 [Petromyzon marinus]XP_032820494.1 uncharacterized protein LOC116948118 [Petromyzon marinus]
MSTRIKPQAHIIQPGSQAVRAQISVVVAQMEKVLKELKEVAMELREVIAQIDKLTANLHLEEEDNDSESVSSSDVSWSNITGLYFEERTITTSTASTSAVVSVTRSYQSQRTSFMALDVAKDATSTSNASTAPAHQQTPYSFYETQTVNETVDKKHCTTSSQTDFQVSYCSGDLQATSKVKVETASQLSAISEPKHKSKVLGKTTRSHVLLSNIRNPEHCQQALRGSDHINVTNDCNTGSPPPNDTENSESRRVDSTSPKHTFLKNNRVAFANGSLLLNGMLKSVGNQELSDGVPNHSGEFTTITRSCYSAVSRDRMKRDNFTQTTKERVRFSDTVEYHRFCPELERTIQVHRVQVFFGSKNVPVRSSSLKTEHPNSISTRAFVNASTQTVSFLKEDAKPKTILRKSFSSK